MRDSLHLGGAASWEIIRVKKVLLVASNVERDMVPSHRESQVHARTWAWVDSARGNFVKDDDERVRLALDTEDMAVDLQGKHLHQLVDTVASLDRDCSRLGRNGSVEGKKPAAADPTVPVNSFVCRMLFVFVAAVASFFVFLDRVKG